MKLNWFSRARRHNTAVTIACAVILRIVLIIFGVMVDDISTDVKYTDVDYNVFTDASRLIWDGNSPYDRDTYRYPPLLAFILIPNIFFPSFGKVVTR
jgi:GPI mannosyltransferase 1 subunit M